MAEPLQTFVEHYDADLEYLWIAEIEGQFAGCIAIVKADEQTAQLRWFIIEPGMRGKGLGKRLVNEATAFCKEKNYANIFLWTIQFLAPARHLYERAGFRITETAEHHIWGRHLVEERWDLSLK